MKKTFVILGLALVALSFSSCSKEKRHQKLLVGTWNFEQKSVIVSSGPVGNPSYSNGTMEIKDDLSGTLTIIDNQGNAGVTPFQLVTSEDAETVTVSYDNADPIVYTVEENFANYQRWTARYDFFSSYDIESEITLDTQ